MAAEIKPVEQKNGISNNWKSAFRRIELLSRIEGLPFQYNHALLFGEECQAVVAACNNKLVKIWIKNNRNKYICSTEHFVPGVFLNFKMLIHSFSNVHMINNFLQTF